jgi:hypothetical protein
MADDMSDPSFANGSTQLPIAAACHFCDAKSDKFSVALERHLKGKYGLK